MKLKIQEYEDLLSALDFAIFHPIEASPAFNKTVVKLAKKLRSKKWKEYLTKSLSERILERTRE